MSNSEKNINLDKTVINWYPGHMAKAKREIKEKLNLIDIVYEIIDSRMPKSSRINDLDELIGDKPRIMVYTKYDLCDKNVTDKFISEYNSDLLIKTNLKESSNFTKELLNKTEKLLSDINAKRLTKGLNKRNYRALVVGVPNVGKSTLINRLAGRNIQDTGNKAGITKSISWIKLNKDIELMDTPGILWPKIDNNVVAYNLASFTSIKEEILNKEEIAIYIIETLYKYYPIILKEKYGIIDISDMSAVFDVIGKKRGCIVKGGVVDLEKVYQIIINDVKEGKIGKVTFDR